METITNIMLDPELVKEAKELTKLKTTTEVVDYALHELVKTYRRRKLLDLRHHGLWEGNLDEMRRKRDCLKPIQ